MSMTSRERVLAAINHQEPDRVPIVIGASNATSMKLRPYRRLIELLGIQSEDTFIYDWPELGTVLPEDRVLQRLHSDVRGVWDRFPEATIQRNRSRPPHSPYIDDWGTGQEEIEPGVWFPSIHSMSDAKTLEEIEAYPWPDMDDPYRVAHVREHARKLAEENQYAILATPWLLFPFERAYALQGMEHFFPNLVTHRDFAVALLRKIAELCKTLMGHFLDELGDYVDIIKIGDDLGMQSGLLISPKMYREILKPIHADYIAFIKSRTNAQVFFHTDGDVFDLVEDLVEIGVDILNPIQTSAGKMADLEGLKKRYGKNLSFCGAVDTFRILPYGSPEQVRQEVRRVIDILGPGGGYLVASVHTILDEVPPENILAMVDAVEEFGSYPLRK
ncbi:MAG TPA: uroporphyrinogen decarboxylase family protein [Anaerolineales bacterium]|nr:uroporphyrinogen decarboxylase family protein [Anaerolineales bacterium]